MKQTSADIFDIVPSPKLPHIPSGYQEKSPSDYILHRSSEPDEHVRPLWAATPEISRAIGHQQRALRPEEIFGEVQPVRLEGNAPFLPD